MTRTLALTAVLLMSVAAAPAFAASDATYSTNTTNTQKVTTTTSTYKGSNNYSNARYTDRDEVAVIPTLKIGGGFNDVFEDDSHGSAFRAELHSTFKFLNDVPVIDSVHPFIGADTTNHGGAYVYGGIATDLEFAPQWILTPSLAAGWYNQGGAKDIGTEFALRPGVEVAYMFENQNKLGVELTDTTGVGSDDSNVGQVMATYSMPFGVMGSF